VFRGFLINLHNKEASFFEYEGDTVASSAGYFRYSLAHESLCPTPIQRQVAPSLFSGLEMKPPVPSPPHLPPLPFFFSRGPG